MAERVVDAAGGAAGRDRLERARGRRLGAEPRARRRRRSRLARRRGRRRAGRGPSRAACRAYVVVHADLPLADVARRGRRRRRRARRRHRSRPSRRRHARCSSLPTAAPFTFAYGPGSAARHADEARRRALTSGSCATRRSASTSTSRPTSPRSTRCATEPPGADDASRVDLPVPRACSPSAPTPTTSSSAAAPRSRSGRTPAPHVTMCICTDGSKGTWDGDADLARAHRDARRRTARRGRRSSAPIDVVFLRYVDGELDSGLRAARRGVPRDPRGAARRRARPRSLAAVPASTPTTATPGCSSRRASSPRATRTSSPSRASRRTGRRRCCCFEPGTRRPRRGRRRLRRPQDRRAARAPQPVALDDGDRRPTPTTQRAAFAAKLHAEARAAGLRAGPARGRGVRPHRRPVARADLRRTVPDAKKDPVARALLRNVGTRSYFFFAVRLRVVRRSHTLGRRPSSRPCASTLLGRLRLAGAFFLAALRLAGAFFGRLALDGLLRRLALGRSLLRLPCAWPEPSSLPYAWPSSSAAFRFAGAFFAALRLAGAFLAALFFVAFLAGGTVTTFPESSHSGKFELRRSFGARGSATPRPTRSGPLYLGFELRAHGELRALALGDLHRLARVRGSIPVRALRSAGENVPKPGSVTFSPAVIADCTELMNALSALSASVLLRFASARDRVDELAFVHVNLHAPRVCSCNENVFTHERQAFLTQRAWHPPLVARLVRRSSDARERA